ncbi:MAG: N-acetyl-gamma-glutamyl-phosphate reductase, partial [Veillonella parvula]
MTPHRVFIVGHEGTTGLRIHERLSDRKDIELLATADEDRKNVEAIKVVAKKADIVFLCLPDAASKDIMAVIGDLPCKVIDTSTAFRTDSDWAYGFPELGTNYKTAIATKKHIANPGCHASGMIACIAPLVKAGLVPADYPFTITSLTGYSGGGKKMIGQYESSPKDYFL